MLTIQLGEKTYTYEVLMVTEHATKGECGYDVPRRIMSQPRIKTRAGDAHAFAENRTLILGGVLIPYEKGLMGHSDADVLCHAISDATVGRRRTGGHWAAFSRYRPYLLWSKQHHAIAMLCGKGAPVGICRRKCGCGGHRPRTQNWPAYREHMTHHIARRGHRACAGEYQGNYDREHMGFTGRKEA